MMFVSPHLKFDPTRPVPPMVEPLCNLRLEVTAEVNLHTFAAGQIWAYPLARYGQTGLVGLKLTPGLTLAESPVVEVDGAQGVTVASSAAYLVPVRLWSRMIGGGVNWNAIAGLPANIWNDLVAFHHQLGGHDDLEAVRALARDKAIKAACEKGAGDFKGLVSAVLEAQQRVDQAPETAVYADVMTRAIVHGMASTPPANAGCWSDALNVMSLIVNSGPGKRSPEEKAAASWRLLHQPPGLDTDRRLPGLAAGMDQAWASKAIRSAAKLSIRRADEGGSEDALRPAIEALAAERTYNGSAHLAAAMALEKQKNFDGAFDALCASAFWETAATGGAMRDILGPARALARKAGWEQIVDCLDEMSEVLKEAKAELASLHD